MPRHIQLKTLPLYDCFFTEMTYRSAQEKSSLIAFRRGTPLARNNVFRGEKWKSLISPKVFSAKFRGETRRKFAEKLRDISQRNSATFRGETPRRFAEKLRDTSRRNSATFRDWYVRFMRTARTLVRRRNWANAQLDMSLHSTGHKTNSESLRHQYNHRMCGHRGGRPCNCNFII